MNTAPAGQRVQHLPGDPVDWILDAHDKQLTYLHESMHALTAYLVGSTDIAMWTTPPEVAQRTAAKCQHRPWGMRPEDLTLVKLAGYEAEFVRHEQLGYTREKFPQLWNELDYVDANNSDRAAVAATRREYPHLVFDEAKAKAETRRMLADPYVQAAHWSLADALRARPAGVPVRDAEIRQILQPFSIYSFNDPDTRRLEVWTNPSPQSYAITQRLINQGKVITKGPLVPPPGMRARPKPAARPRLMSRLGLRTPERRQREHSGRG